MESLGYDSVLLRFYSLICFGRIVRDQPASHLDQGPLSDVSLDAQKWLT